ncbi:uncharacterized protein LOC126656793 [Mercurialis annua]|uniref:uncharacterized protein LOC126656793 n=1 Tax=Mercurialis annua TaxID=3986 RepID=UPI002160D869|nr:uncharacterized protein LOC126656793 [Mercurialis annua]
MLLIRDEKGNWQCGEVVKRVARDYFNMLFRTSAPSEQEEVFRCVNSVLSVEQAVSFSVMINGYPYGYIIPQRGLRQGDPLSPYLFLLCIEGFSAMLRKGEVDGKLTGGTVCRGIPTINHLFFADDSILFAKAEVQECTQQQLQTGIDKILGFREVESFHKYLGMPTLIGRLRKPIFSFLRDILHKWIAGWKERFLSKVGREALIKSVAQSISTYIMSCFALPISFCNEMQSSTARFYWSDAEDKNKISWISWDTISKSKEKGGLGFRNLCAFNLAMLAKQVWRLFQFPESICSKVFQAKYYPDGDVLTATAKRMSNFF